jgi:mannitol-1-/sugar-/sorbitol-6-/2-deoxyglucose-6-phosphatase
MNNTVIFDMDGLLLDTEPLWGISMTEVVTARKIPVGPDKFRETTGLKIHEVVHYWSLRYAWKDANIHEVAEEIVDHIIALSRAEATVMPGALDLLTALKSAGFRLAVATSSPNRMLQELIRHFGLNGYFEELISADAVAYGKPHPAVFLHCAEKLQVSPLQAVVLEDSVNGVIAAKAARMKAIAVPAIHHYEDLRFSLAEWKVRSLEQLSAQEIAAL